MYAVSGSASASFQNTSGLRVDRQADAPHDARPAGVADGAPFANQLDGDPRPCGERLDVVVQVEVVACTAREAGLPPIGEVDEHEVELGPVSRESLDSPHDVLGKDHVRRLGHLDIGVDPILKLDVARRARRAHSKPENLTEPWPVGR